MRELPVIVIVTAMVCGIIGMFMLDRHFKEVAAERQRAIDHCFSVYNDRPLNSDGRLPFSQGAQDAMETCFRELRHRS